MKRGEDICSKGLGGGGGGGAYFHELICTRKEKLVLHGYMFFVQLQHPILMGGRGLADPLVPKNRIQHVRRLSYWIPIFVSLNNS